VFIQILCVVLISCEGSIISGGGTFVYLSGNEDDEEEERQKEQQLGIESEWNI
jgi:hypothetical protein